MKVATMDVVCALLVIALIFTALMWWNARTDYKSISRNYNYVAAESELFWWCARNSDKVTKICEANPNLRTDKLKWEIETARRIDGLRREIEQLNRMAEVPE